MVSFFCLRFSNAISSLKIFFDVLVRFIQGGHILNYLNLSKEKLKEIEFDLKKEYEKLKALNLKLDMSRGKPSPEQTELSLGLLDTVKSNDNLISESGIDCKNYGTLDGLPEMKKIFSEILEIGENNIIIGGNSSLSLMFDAISYFMTHGVLGSKPWASYQNDSKNIKFLCPSPGYDRHFAILDFFNIEPIVIPMLKTGPDMDLIEKLISEDETIKGIWCVPKYSNPQGITYSDETVKRFSKLKPKAFDFRISWDNAYAIHDLSDTPDKLSNLMEHCKKNHTENLPLMFCSTSKITFPGAGVAAIGASDDNINYIKKMYSFKTIGYDKINQLRHIRYFKTFENIKLHMEKHKSILKPKFDIVLNALENNFFDNKIVSWETPKGGYFISIDVAKGCAKNTVRLCKNLGLILTPAGSTFPKKLDPNDSNIRIAPSYPSLEELKKAMDVLCLCIKLAFCEKILSENM